MSKSNWPAWFYGPSGAAMICAAEGEVPKGWQDHPSKVEEADKPAPAKSQAPAKATPAPSPAPTPAPAPAAQKPAQVPGGTGGPELDADGHPWSADLHAATQTMTKAGLWRMKVGVARPDPVKFDL